MSGPAATSPEGPPYPAIVLPVILRDSEYRRGWAITHLGMSPGGYWFGMANFLRSGPFEDGPTFGFRAGEATREDCIRRLQDLVGGEIRKGLWTEIAPTEA